MIKMTPMKKAFDLLNKGAVILKNAGIKSYRYDSTLIFEHATGVKRADVILQPSMMVLRDTPYYDMLAKRAEGYPLQYILGHWEFMGLDFEVNENVLIPRADTETLVNYIKRLGGAPRVLDMCTGSGCIGISVKHCLKDATVTLADISFEALEVAKRNAHKNETDVEIVRADLTYGYKPYFEKDTFDIIVANPPYIKTKDMESLSRELSHEPYTALCGGEDGTDFYKDLISKWKGALKPGGIMVLESGYDTWQAIEAIFADNGYVDITNRKDWGGNVRLVCARRKDEDN